MYTNIGFKIKYHKKYHFESVPYIQNYRVMLFQALQYTT